jgi:hypothetical protein
LRGVVGFMLQYLWSIVSQKIICFLAGWGSGEGDVLSSRLCKFEVLLACFPIADKKFIKIINLFIVFLKLIYN